MKRLSSLLFHHFYVSVYIILLIFCVSISVVVSPCGIMAQQDEVLVNEVGKKALANAGKPVTEFMFDDIQKFANGLYVAIRDGKRGLLSPDGHQVAMTIYETMEPLKNGKILVRLQGKTGILNADGTVFVRSVYDAIIMGTGAFSKVMIGSNVGLLDSMGVEIVKPLYDDVRVLKNGFCEVKRGKKIGFVGQNAQELLAPIYDDIRFLSNGRVELHLGKLIGYCTKELQMLVPAEYEKVTFLADGKAMVVKAGKTGYYSASGALLVPAVYDQARFFPDGKVYVTLNRKNGILTAEGKEFVPAKYDNIRFERQHIIRAETNVPRSSHVYTSAGMRYDGIGKFVGQIARVERGGKYGLLDTAGLERVACVYDSLAVLDSLQCVRAVQKGKVLLVNLDGTMRTDSAYDEIDEFSEYRARVKIGGLYGYINEKGFLVIPAKYSTAERFSGTVFLQARVEEAGKALMIDVQGGVVAEIPVPQSTEKQEKQ